MREYLQALKDMPELDTICLPFGGWFDNIDENVLMEEER